MAYSHTPSELPKDGPEKKRGLPEVTQHAQGRAGGQRTPVSLGQGLDPGSSALACRRGSPRP